MERDRTIGHPAEILPGPLAAPVPDPQRIELLEKLTSADNWPRAWLTVIYFSDLLLMRNFWDGTMLSEQEQCAWLTRTFLGVHYVDPRDRKPTFIWCRLRDTFKHHSLVTAADRQLMAEEIRQMCQRVAAEREATP